MDRRRVRGGGDADAGQARDGQQDTGGSPECGQASCTPQRLTHGRATRCHVIRVTTIATGTAPESPSGPDSLTIRATGRPGPAERVRREAGLTQLVAKLSRWRVESSRDLGEFRSREFPEFAGRQPVSFPDVAGRPGRLLEPGRLPEPGADLLRRSSRRDRLRQIAFHPGGSPGIPSARLRRRHRRAPGSDVEPLGYRLTATGSMGTATGAGEFFLNECNPNCAQGHDQTYPVQVNSVGRVRVVGRRLLRSAIASVARQQAAGTKSMYTVSAPS
jgi:hypothetical protein